MPFDSNPDYWPWAEQNLTAESIGIFVELLAWLDKGGDRWRRFNYCTWSCGTSACIGGWIDVRLNDDVTYDDYEISRRLGIDAADAQTLFYGAGEWTEVTPPVAASCIRHMLATGEVDWPRAFETA